jgi:transcriptional regulator with XRE-family HTH domain
MIGRRLKELRKARGWLQQDAAQKLDITVKHYSQLERNKAQPSMALLEKIAELFEVEVWDLYEKPPSGGARQLATPGKLEFGAGKNQRLLFKDLAPRLTSATTRLALHLDRLDDAQVEQALQCGMELISIASAINHNATNE